MNKDIIALVTLRLNSLYKGSKLPSYKRRKQSKDRLARQLGYTRHDGVAREYCLANWEVAIKWLK